MVAELIKVSASHPCLSATWIYVWKTRTSDDATLPVVLIDGQPFLPMKTILLETLKSHSRKHREHDECDRD